MYFDVFENDYSFCGWFDVMIDSEIEQGSIIEKKDFTNQQLYYEGTTKDGRCFYNKAICKIAYECGIIITVKLGYKKQGRRKLKI